MREHIASTGVITTLFPHLGHPRQLDFRLALIAGMALVLVLYITGFVTGALLAAAFLVPLLYLIYLYEAQVYRDEPAWVLGVTFGGGIVLGVVLALVAMWVTGSQDAVITSRRGSVINLGPLLLTGLLIPIVQEVVKPLPALFLPNRSKYTHGADGLVLGVAAGMGFALAQTLIGFAGVLRTLDIRTDPGNWIYPLISAAVLVPLLQGSATGLITAALWRTSRARLSNLDTRGIVVAVFAHISFSLGSQLIGAAGAGNAAVVAWQLLVVGALIVAVRVVLHEAVLFNVTAGVGPPTEVAWR